MTAGIYVAFVVPGRPQPAGSKRAFAIKKGGVPTGRVTVVDDNARSRDFKQAVAAAATDAMTGGLLTGPLALRVEFVVRRPRTHYGTGRNADTIRPTAPPRPAVRPDLTKLLRAVEDGMTGIAWIDDAQVVVQLVSKRYGWPERTQISVWTLTGAPAPAEAGQVPLPFDDQDTTTAREEVKP